MSSPLEPAVARGRSGWWVAGALLLLLIAWVRPMPALAEDQPDPFTITVRVDATSDNAVNARRLARLDGERRALARIVAQLAGSEGVKLPKLSDSAVSDMVDNFEVANEHMSAVRYLAEYTFHFHPSAVRRLMQQSGIAVAGSSPPPANSETPMMSGDNAAPSAAGGGPGGSGAAVVLPVFEDGASPILWDDPNPWRDAWSERPPGSGADRLTVPLGGVSDLTAIDAPQALAGQPDALGAIAAHYGGGDAIVALATAERQDDRLSGLRVTVKRYRQGQIAGTQTLTFSVNPGEGEADFLRRAVAGTAAAIDSGANAVAAGTAAPTSVTATVPISGLGEWVEVRARLEGVPGVRKVDLLSLSRQEARIEITYSGTADQLKSSLAEAQLDLGGSDAAWQVRPADAASPR